ncbi:MAG: hypothetical protein QG573_41 [Acidobacteriota bacterium]|nr:hypothetical protein [Acidobacteriota bacterium]
MAARPPRAPDRLPGTSTVPNGAPLSARKAAAEWHRFYAHPSVGRRHQEYLGGRSLETSSAVFLTSPSPRPDSPELLQPVTALPAILASKFDVARSLWDRRYLLVHLDVEHVHFDRPWEPLVYPKRSLFVQRDVVATIAAVLAEFGLEAVHLLTGRGHHFVWKIGRRSAAFAALVRLATLSDSLRTAYAAPQPPGGESVGESAGAAWDGLGKVMEYLGHRILLAASALSPVPVQLTAVVVGPGAHGREIVAIDLSEYADPLHKRSIRLPFTAYLKAERHGWLPPPPAMLPRLIAIPDPGDEEEGIRIMREPALAAAFARHCRTVIPDASLAMEGLIAAYEQSDLAAFHRHYYAEEADPPELWPATYDRLDIGSLPACAGRILEHPNDLLLQPGAIQLVVRVLLAEGWHPRHIAGLIRSRYERPYGWLADFHFHDPTVRAEVYTRIFAGLIALGIDQMVDFNCTSTQEKHLCPGTGCPWNLEGLRAAAEGWGGHG